jgi:hypothetical protein
VIYLSKNDKEGASDLSMSPEEGAIPKSGLGLDRYDFEAGRPPSVEFCDAEERVVTTPEQNLSGGGQPRSRSLR